MSNHILDMLTTPCNVHELQVTRLLKKTKIFDPFFTLGMKIKIPKPYRKSTCTRHTQAYPIASFVYYEE